MSIKRNILFIFFCCFLQIGFSQKASINWMADGLNYTIIKDGRIIKVNPKTEAETILVSRIQLTPLGTNKALLPQSYSFSKDNNKILIFTNTAKVWRYNTRGDYWVYDLLTNKLSQIGKTLPAQSLMFAKFSPDGRYVAYVSDHNIYAEEISGGLVRKQTTDGSRKLIYGTFDWAYEEEFGARDGFRWSPDGKQIAFWQVDATKIKDYYMLNTTDSNYSTIIPVEYPKVGESPSSVRIGVVTVANANIKWMKIDGNPQQQYITRMEWSGPNELVVQQLNRHQEESRLIYCKPSDGTSYTFWAEDDAAWVDLNTDDPSGWKWINKGSEFLWVSEKDGWRHIYKISHDGKIVSLITKGNYDIGSIKAIDEAANYIYFTASPNNATQLSLYRIHITNANKLVKEEPELLSDVNLKGTHDYDFSPTAKTSLHSFSNYNTLPVKEWMTFPENKPLIPSKSISANLKTDNSINVEYLKIITADSIVLDAWINKPKNFNPNKKYPVVFYVYGEPGASVVNNEYGNHTNFLYNGDMNADGYIQVALDNRGTPSLKGAAWRKSIYRKIGLLNIRDMAMGAKKILENKYIDTSRVAVWGWSGGGSSTLNLMFQYPEIFKTGIAIAAVTNQLFYDNIYQERYMGLPYENREDFVKGSPISYVKGLRGNLLYIHGTGDDNVHYSNAEVLLNELIKYNKQFQFMAYPNRTHNLSEGEGSWLHLSTLYTNFLRKNCPPGER